MLLLLRLFSFFLSFDDDFFVEVGVDDDDDDDDGDVLVRLGAEGVAGANERFFIGVISL